MDPKKHADDKKTEPEELLEECWFFGNLLDKRKTIMLRSFSDPCTSLNFSPDTSPGKSYEEAFALIKKLPEREELTRRNLIKATSMPPSTERKDQNTPTSKGKLRSKKTSSNNLVRVPSLPISLKNDEFEDEEIEFSMGKLIRQASMNNSSNTLPPRTNAAKGLTLSSSSITRNRSRRKPEIVQGIKLVETMPQRVTNKLKTQKSFNYIESEVLQGVNNLGFEEKNTKMLYNYVAWRRQSSSAPPVPKWGEKRVTETDDMKEQIKFWARAVASNVADFAY